MGELESCAKANSILTLVLRCWPAPMPPTYLCRHPNANELPVRETTSLAVFNLLGKHKIYDGTIVMKCCTFALLEIRIGL